MDNDRIFRKLGFIQEMLKNLESKKQSKDNVIYEKITKFIIETWGQNNYTKIINGGSNLVGLLKYFNSSDDQKKKVIEYLNEYFKNKRAGL